MIFEFLYAYIISYELQNQICSNIDFQSFKYYVIACGK